MTNEEYLKFYKSNQIFLNVQISVISVITLLTSFYSTINNVSHGLTAILPTVFTIVLLCSTVACICAIEAIDNLMDTKPAIIAKGKKLMGITRKINGARDISFITGLILILILSLEKIL